VTDHSATQQMTVSDASRPTDIMPQEVPHHTFNRHQRVGASQWMSRNPEIIEPRFYDRSACSQVTIPTVISLCTKHEQICGTVSRPWVMGVRRQNFLLEAVKQWTVIIM
jgi:hypothetical protein